MRPFVILLLTTTFIVFTHSQNYGWWDSQPCHPSCYDCYYGNNNRYCSQCAGNHLAQHWYYYYTYCYCANGYVELNQPNCAPCSYFCATCSSNPSNCASCPSTRSGTPSCNCMNGYYQNGQSTCPRCHYSCLTCNAGTANDCLTCNSADNRYLSGTSCLCSDPFYDNGSNSACQPCDSSCDSCNSSAGCSSCDSTKFRYFSNKSTYCLCMDRYYHSGVQTCRSCYPTCYNCTNNRVNTCNACNPLSFRILSGSTCICKNGYYETSSTVELCTICSYSCLTCNINATYCLTCNASLNRVLSNNACPCKPLYFQNSTLLCETCNPSCATCTNKTVCLTCIASQGTTLNSSNLCSCTSSQYFNGSVCLACNYRCLTCKVASTNCTSCQVNTYRIYKSNQCNCQSNYYDNGSLICAPCAYSCLTCNGSATTNCLSCSGPTLRVLSSSKCVCPTGQFDDGNPNCSPCNYKCQSCTNSTSCLSCSSAKFRSLNATTGYCECYSNYFQFNQVCYVCMTTCLTCNNNQTCTSCNSGIFLTLNSDNLCVCQTGYYNLSGACLPCNSLCISCIAANTCTACKSGLNRFLNTNTSTCDCLSGYVLNTSSNLCLGCHYSCQVCVTNFTNQCSSCNSSYYRTLNTTTNQCPCNIGYYDNNAPLCLACSYTCYTCTTSATFCTSCTDGSNRSLNTTAGTCNCDQHYYDTIVVYIQNVICAACPYMCSSCTNVSACLTCNSSNYRIFDSLNIKCICAQGFYDDGTNELCLKCPYQCSSCTNSSVCLTCNSSMNRDTPASVCPCLNGFYDTNSSNQLCAACHYSCKTCNIGTMCDTCQANYNRLFNSTTNYCSCADRFYDNGTQICKSCTYSCRTCSGGPLNCLTCNTTARRSLNTVKKSCLCRNGYYDGAIELCYPCNYTCSTCGNNQSCLTCNISRFRTINPATALCICITGYYDNNSTQTCLRCNLTCLTCINSTKCLTCDANRKRVYNTTKNYANFSNPYCPCFYSHYSLGLNSNCAACHSSCAACSGPNKTNCLYCDANSKRTLNGSTCTCNVGYYDTNTTMNCPVCNVACTSCWNSLTTTCFTCNPTYFMMVGKNTCYSKCPTYYFNNVTAKICTLCSTHCLTCVDSTNCTSCQAPVFLYEVNATCLGSCPLGYYGNSTYNICILCRVGCANCSTISNCFKCTNSSYYVDKATTLCFICSSKCLTCFGPNPNQCLNCVYPQHLNKQNTCVNISCPFGKYIDTFKGCVNCSQLFNYSLTCTITQALLCMQTKQLKNGKCVQCNEVLGYAIDSTGKCNQICGDGILIKYQCDDGNTHNGDGCSSNCVIEQGWNCTVVSSRSQCKLITALNMSLKQLKKYPRQNKLLITLKISIPLYLDNTIFSLVIVEFDSKYYDFDVQPQKNNDFTQVSVLLSYTQSIQSKSIQIKYKNSRRLTQLDQVNQIKLQSQERLLTTINFETQVIVSAFPPANFIETTTTNFYQKGITIIFYLSIVLSCINFLIVPQRYAVHSLTISWIIPYFYITFFRATSYTNQWISSTLSQTQYPSLLGGISFGSCCYNDTFLKITSQIFSNTGYIFAGLIASWTLFLLSKLIDKCRTGNKQSKSSSIFKYYLLTLHLTFILQLSYSSLYALSKYQINNRIDAANITISLFITLSVFFLVCMLWYVTCTNKFVGTEEQLQSQVATKQSASIEKSNRTEEAQYNQVINLSEIKEINSRDESKFYSSTNFKASSSQMKEQRNSDRRSVESQEQQMGDDESLLPYDYCYIYKNKDSRSKYYLPILITKLLLISLFNVVMQSLPFYLMVMNLILSALFLIFLVRVRPFNSSFTNARNIIVQILIVIVNGLYCVYQYYANSKTYVSILQTCILSGIIAIIGLSTIFCFVQHYRIWIHRLWKLCDGCCLYFKLKGKSQKVMDNSRQRQKIIVQQVSQAQVMQSDAFYARVLKKQALNRQYRNERMGRNTIQKDFL